MRVTPERARQIFGNPSPPKLVREAQFDQFDEQLQRIARQDWREIEHGDLWYYLHDLAYVDLQPDLFHYLFPVCLDFWYRTLMCNESAAVGDADFHYSIAQGRILDRMVTPEQRAAILDYFHDGFLDRIEAERGFVYAASGTPAYAWINRFGSLGYVAPIIDRIWASWWKLDHPGKAVSAIMYATGLVYLKGENPVFGAWTRETGGGGPNLLESDSHIYDAPWMESNLRWLSQRLSVQYVQERLAFAARQLRHEPEEELARKVASDASHRDDVIQIRIDDLIEGLSKGCLGSSW